jgi:excisionase family DNA binding protein
MKAHSEHGTTADTKAPPFASAFLSLDEAAREIGCTRRFIETRIADGELKKFSPSKRLVRIRRTDFERWIEAYSTQGAA